MKKTILLTISIFCLAGLLKAQTWNGSLSQAWNIADNWTPSGVPTAAGNVIIPTGTSNYPKLNAAVTVNTLTMQPGSKMDVNGFVFNINAVDGYTNVSGATISNSDASKDIVFNVNTGVNGYNASFSKDTLTDNVIFNITGSNNFYEGTEAGHFMFNATYNLANSGNSYIAHQGKTLYAGNLSINRTAGGNTDVFSGGGTVTGNFTYNTSAGNSSVGNTTTTANIAGVVNMNVNPAASTSFTLYRIKNETAGGTISVKNTTGFDVRNDTLKLATFVIEDYKTGYGYLFNNEISATGQIKISDDVTFGSGYNTAVNGNIFNGSSLFLINGTNAFYEVTDFNAPNIYNGPATFTAAGTGTLNIGYSGGSTFNGALSVSRAIAGETNIFSAGMGKVNGNFSYTNLAGGNTSIGTKDIGSYVSGMVNINAVNNTAAGYFRLYRLMNQLSGGTISINKSSGVDIRADTLKLNAFTVAGYITGYTQIFNNDIAATNISISDDPAFGGGYNTDISSNVFTGNCNFTVYGTNNFVEANGSTAAGNIYNGNTSFTGAGTGQFLVGNSAASTYNGNVNIIRTVASSSYYFTGGANISGNLSYTNNVGGGLTIIGNISAKTAVGGMFNFTANNSLQGQIELYHIVNQTSGGSIDIQNTSGINIQHDTLKVTSFKVSGLRNGYFTAYNNLINGNVNISDDVSNGGGYTLISRGNVFTGTTSYTLNGSNNYYDGDNNIANIYNGNVTYNRPGTGLINIGSSLSGNSYAQDLILNSTGGINISRLNFSGSSNGVFQQQGTQPLIVQKMAMAKTATGQLTLNSPVTITDSLFFTGGNIQSSATNILNFADNAKHMGSSSLSHIIGPVAKTGDDAFTFPTGAALSIDSVSISAPASVTDRFSAQYFYADPSANGYDTAQRAVTLKRVSGCEYWDVKRESGASNVSITLGFDGACIGGGRYVTNPAAARVAHWNGSSWDDLGNGGFTGSYAGTVKTAAIITSFSPFTIASTDIVVNPLPLKLISFKGFRQGEKIKLLWQTENETALAKYELQKSTDGIQFFPIGNFTAGNTTGTHNYSGNDEHPVKGFNYYRLKQLNTDGSFTYSNIVKIIFDEKISLSISPNPVKDKLSVNEAVTGDVIRVIDVQGRIVRTYIVKTVNQEVSVAGLPAGVYVLQLVNKNTVQTIQFIKQ